MKKRIMIRSIIAGGLIFWVWKETAMYSISVTIGVMFLFIELSEFAIAYLTDKVYGLTDETIKVAGKKNG